MEHTDSFRAMDTTVDLVVLAPARPVVPFLEARLLFTQQEARFSRFRTESLLSRFNRGQPIADPWFDAALRLALAAWEETGGLYHPLILPALAAAGYDRTFAEVRDGAPLPIPPPDPRVALAHTPRGWQLRSGQLDLGGIVKGWTADLAAEHLAATLGAPVLVNAGGDIRCLGEERPGLGGWQVDIEHPAGGTAWAGICTGAIATSTTLRRRWRTADGRAAHHLIDPRTGLPAETPYVQVSALAPTCARAESWAKAVLVGGPAALQQAAERGLAVLALCADGRAERSPSWPQA